eukprot:Trichotokara_eunicae@DN7626_c0_g1_i1.p2
MPLRSAFHPHLVAVLYKAMDLFGIVSPNAFAYAPRIIFGTLTAALCDLGTYEVAKLWSGGKTASLAMLCSLFGWYSNFMYTRSSANSLEALFTIWGVYYGTRYVLQKQNR